MLPRLLTLLLSTLVSLALVSPVQAAPPSEAMDAFKKRHESVLKLVRKKASSKKLQAEVDLLLDYHWIAEASLGGPKKFQKRCEPRCSEFENLLTKLIREAYLKRIRMADKGTVEYLDEQKRPQASKVNTKVTFKQNGRDQTVEIAYVMHKVDDRWQVRDFITDGVSLARNYKYEFNKILREHGIDELIARLETKIAEVAKTN